MVALIVIVCGIHMMFRFEILFNVLRVCYEAFIFFQNLEFVGVVYSIWIASPHHSDSQCVLFNCVWYFCTKLTYL